MSGERRFRMVDLIKQKRDGIALSDAALEDFIARVVSDRVEDYQTAALLMAIYFQGLDDRELTTLSRAMLHSGRVLDFPSLEGVYKVDKHSTGGVGDKVSLVLAPMIAACGLYVPMVSGRGLGHTGGTLDKLEAIPGLNVELDPERFERCVAGVGFAITGQTGDIAPADRKLYSLRDVTGTVPSKPLIAASIMSKKLAEGLNGLVLDVKVGSGAFMRTVDDARALAKMLIKIGEGMGCQTRALLTNMNQPLGRAVGHANEVREAIATLQGRGPDDLLDVCLELGTQMLQMNSGQTDDAISRARLLETLSNGSAFERFRAFVVAQGGDVSAVDDPSTLPNLSTHQPITATTSGYITGFNCADVGRACSLLGGGREQQGDSIDHAVGIEVLVKLGDRVERGAPLFDVTYRNEADRERAEQVLRAAVTLSDAPPETKSGLVLERLAGS